MSRATISCQISRFIVFHLAFTYHSAWQLHVEGTILGKYGAFKVWFTYQFVLHFLGRFGFGGKHYSLSFLLRDLSLNVIQFVLL